MINLTDTVDVVKAGGYDKWGIEIAGETLKDVECKVMYSLKQEELENTSGEMVRVTARVFFEELYYIKFGDTIRYIDDFGVEHMFEILDIKPIKDFSDEVIFTRVVV